MSRICIDCRTILRDGEQCEGRGHRAASLTDRAERALLESEVWDRQSAPSSSDDAAGNVHEVASGAEALGLLGGIASFVAGPLALYALATRAVGFVRGKVSGGAPTGARLEAPKPRSCVIAAVGVVERGVAVSMPWRSELCLGYAFELHAREQVMLRGGWTAGFDLRLASGRSLRVPPGTLRITGGMRRQEGDAVRLERLVAELDPERRDADRSLFPHDVVRAATLSVGDCVELVGPIETTSEGDYRSTIEQLTSKAFVRLKR